MKTATLKATGSGIQEPLLRAGDRGDGPWGGDDGMSFGCGPWTYTQPPLRTARAAVPHPPHLNCKSVYNPCANQQPLALSTNILTMLLCSRSTPFCPFRLIGPTAVQAHAVNTRIPSTAPAEPPAAVSSPFR